MLTSLMRPLSRKNAIQCISYTTNSMLLITLEFSRRFEKFSFFLFLMKFIRHNKGSASTIQKIQYVRVYTRK